MFLEEDCRFGTSNNYITQRLPIRLVTRSVGGVVLTLKPVMEASKRKSVDYGDLSLERSSPSTLKRFDPCHDEDDPSTS